MRLVLVLAVYVFWAAALAAATAAAAAAAAADGFTLAVDFSGNTVPTCIIHRWSDRSAGRLLATAKNRSCCNVNAGSVSSSHSRSCFDKCGYHSGDRSWPPQSMPSRGRSSHCLTTWRTIRSSSHAPNAKKVHNQRRGKGVRCGLGDVARYDFEGLSTVERVTDWLLQLECRFYLARLFPASIAALLHSFRACNATVVVFYGGSGTAEISMAVTLVLHRYSPGLCGLFVEADSQEAAALAEYCGGISSRPAVTLLRRYRGSTEVVTVPSDSSSSIELLSLQAWLLLQPLWRLTRDDFANRVLAFEQDYVPTLVAFYSPWCENASTFLDAFTRTAEHASDVATGGLRFATLDLSDHHTAVLLLSRFSPSRCLFVMLFYVRNDSLNEVAYWELVADLPTPVQVVGSLSTNADFVESTGFIVAKYITWGASSDELSRLTEGPFGTQCYITSSNLTESDPHFGCTDFEERHGKRMPLGSCRRLSDRVRGAHSSGSSENEHRSQLETYHGLKIVTSDYWRSILTRPVSAASGVAVQAGSNFSTRTLLGLFIRKTCASCESSMPTFTQLASAARGAGMPADLYVINCSHTVDLCNQRLVSGYPSLVAYRPADPTYAAAGCLSPTAIAQLTLGRMKYHGSLTVPQLMRWLAMASAEAVTFINSYDRNSKAEEGGDELSLIATVMPRLERYLPQSRQLGWSHFFPLRCFRLTCEVLFGPVKCYAIRSPAVPASAFEERDRTKASNDDGQVYSDDFVVAKVELRRGDGFNISIMELHRPLIELLEQEEEKAAAAAARGATAAADSDITPGSLHSSHRYGIDRTVTCEANHSVCVDFILQFTRDHGRLPVAHMSPEMFHLPSGLIGHAELPVLVTLMHPDNFTIGSKFSQMLRHVATSLYSSVRVVTVDITMYPAWVAQFAPLSGSLDLRHDEASPLYRYPRFCLVRWSDHSKAAFYPPLSASASEHDGYLSRHGLTDFVLRFLADPESMLVPTGRF